MRHNSVNKIDVSPHTKGNLLSPGGPSGQRSSRSKSPEPQPEEVARRRSFREREPREAVKSSGSATPNSSTTDKTAEVDEKERSRQARR